MAQLGSLFKSVAACAAHRSLPTAGRSVYYGSMYSCVVKKTIWQQADKQGGFVDLRYRVQVDSTPRIGDELRVRDWFSGCLTDVIRNIEYNYFSCRVADEVPYNNGNYQYDYEWLIASALAVGWQLCT